MTNNNILIGVVILVVVAVLGAWWTWSSSQPADQMTDQNPATTTNTTATPGSGSSTTGGSKNTFKSLLTQTGNYECDYEQVSPTARASNRIFMADGKMRAEFRTGTGPDTTATLMVYDGLYLYTWTEGVTVGVKTQLKSLSQLPSAIPTDLTSGAILGSTADSVGWDCHSWKTDKSMLTPPTYVKFVAAS